jgi:hypothetical protein
MAEIQVWEKNKEAIAKYKSKEYSIFEYQYEKDSKILMQKKL